MKNVEIHPKCPYCQKDIGGFAPILNPLPIPHIWLATVICPHCHTFLGFQVCPDFWIVPQPILAEMAARSGEPQIDIEGRMPGSESLRDVIANLNKRKGS